MPVINLPSSPQQSNFDAAVDKMTWWQSLFSPICTTDTDCIPIDLKFLYTWAIVQAILILSTFTSACSCRIDHTTPSCTLPSSTRTTC
ncbi:hypothetical protein B0T09DRAFT_55332 [Sordaria sp. MPI-SDFR-AT-0083]|nr:hypothetical protein B0T09DRAFT_55332 [Sordaria sp. MPI-SDFR-AT-0083]